jgi:hypothetical protein
MVARILMFQARASSVITATVLLLPWVLLMIPVMVLAIASLVVPSQRQCHLLDVLDRLVQIAAALRGSDIDLRDRRPRSNPQCHHLAQEHVSDTVEIPARNTVRARGDATKEHDLAVPTHGAAVSAGGSSRSPELAFNTRATITLTLRGCSRVNAAICSPHRPRPSPCSPRVTPDAWSALAPRRQEGKWRESAVVQRASRRGLQPRFRSSAGLWQGQDSNLGRR